MYFYTGDLPNDILDCTVQMCGFPTLDVVPMDQSIPREMWVKWGWSADYTSAARGVSVYSC